MKKKLIENDLIYIKEELGIDIPENVEVKLTLTEPLGASFTLILHKPFSLAANAGVKAAGMCWISKIGCGKLAGNFVKIVCSATGPPVDVPIATI